MRHRADHRTNITHAPPLVSAASARAHCSRRTHRVFPCGRARSARRGVGSAAPSAFGPLLAGSARARVRSGSHRTRSRIALAPAPRTLPAPRSLAMRTPRERHGRRAIELGALSQQKLAQPRLRPRRARVRHVRPKARRRGGGTWRAPRVPSLRGGDGASGAQARRSTCAAVRGHRRTRAVLWPDVRAGGVAAHGAARHVSVRSALARPLATRPQHRHAPTALDVVTRRQPLVRGREVLRSTPARQPSPPRCCWRLRCGRRSLQRPPWPPNTPDDFHASGHRAEASAIALRPLFVRDHPTTTDHRETSRNRLYYDDGESSLGEAELYRYPCPDTG